MKQSCFPCKAKTAHEELLRVLFSTDENDLSAWNDWADRYKLSLMESGVRELLPLFHVKFKHLPLVDPLIQVLAEEYQRVGDTNQKAFRQVAMAREAMAVSGLRPLVIKGMSLMPYFSDDPALRPMADVDLLVTESESTQAIDCLIRTGWRPSPALGRVDLVRKIVPKQHSFEFFNNQVGLDLHWLPVHRELGGCGAGSIHRHARTVSIQNTPVDVPCVEHQLLLCLLHGLRPQVNRRVQWIVDAMMILKGSAGIFDWSYFDECVNSARLARIVYNMLDYMNRLFELRYPISDVGGGRASILEQLEYEALLKRQPDRTIGESVSMGLRKHYRNLSHRTARESVEAVARSVRNSLSAMREHGYHRSLSWLHNHPRMLRVVTLMRPRFGQACVPDWPVAVLTNNQPVEFGSRGQGFLYTATGWSIPERRHLWSDGWHSRLIFSLQQPIPALTRIVLKVQPFVPKRANTSLVDVHINNRSVARLEYLQPPFPSSQAIFLNQNELDPLDRVDVQFIYLNPGIPEGDSSQSDRRLLGLCLEQLLAMPVDVCNLKTPIHFAANQVGCQYLGRGWWDTEDEGVWSAMHHSDVVLALTSAVVLRELVITLIPFATERDGQVISVRVSGRYSGDTRLCPGDRSVMTARVTLKESPQEALQSEEFLRLDFHATRLKAPTTEFDSVDERKLGFRLVSIHAPDGSITQ